MLPLLTKIAHLKDVPGALPMLSRWRVPYRQHDRIGSNTSRLNHWREEFRRNQTSFQQLVLIRRMLVCLSNKEINHGKGTCMH